jgi:hypothetical protein
MRPVEISRLLRPGKLYKTTVRSFFSVDYMPDADTLILGSKLFRVGMRFLVLGYGEVEDTLKILLDNGELLQVSGKFPRSAFVEEEI